MSDLSKEQKNYATAKANVAALDEMYNTIEREYIEAEDIRNKDGKVPSHLWTMDDDENFEYHNQRLGKIVEESGFEKRYVAAKNALRKAEDALINFAISISPANIQETLLTGAKTNYHIREKLLDAAFRLDMSTAA